VTPRVSVVIPAYRSAATVGGTLAALRRQRFEDFETVVVDSSPDEATAAAVGDFDDVRVVRSAERLLPHAARNRGVREARGAIVAFTDPDCEPAADWLERLVAAHDRGHPLVGGAIVPRHAGEADWRTRAIHRTKFVSATPGGPAGPRRDLASANLAFEARLLERIGPLDESCFCGDTEWCWRASAAGVTPWFEPEAVVEHVHERSIRAFLRERRARGEDFATMRAERSGWPRRARVARGIVAPVVAGVLLARVWRAGRVADGRRPGPGELALEAAGCAAWSAGEARALLRGQRATACPT
jgi:GT2 family glycosyltransferase